MLRKASIGRSTSGRASILVKKNSVTSSQREVRFSTQNGFLYFHVAFFPFMCQ